MAVNWQVVTDIAVPVIALPVGAILDRWLERRPKLITYYGHVSAHELKGDKQPITIHTHEVIVRNTGRKAATNVRLGHATLPDFNVFPSVDYTVADLPGGGKEIVTCPPEMPPL